MTPLVVVATIAAGALGALLRYVATLAFGPSGLRVPRAVLVVNVAGSLVGGLLLGLVDAGVAPEELRTVLVTGFAGGLTTFSTLSVETMQLVLSGRVRTAVLSIALNLVLGIGAATAGYLAIAL